MTVQLERYERAVSLVAALVDRIEDLFSQAGGGVKWPLLEEARRFLDEDRAEREEGE